MRYPSRETIERDVELRHSHVCYNEEGRIVETFCFAPGPDATYAVIKDCKWLNGNPYHVIHRLASDGSAHSFVRGGIIHIADGTTRIAYHYCSESLVRKNA